MNLNDKAELPEGEIWAVSASRPAEASLWCRQLARHLEEQGEKVALLSFSQQAAVAESAGWMQARYYVEEGATVEESLSFETIYEINPYAVRPKLPEKKRVFMERMRRIRRLLHLEDLLDRPLLALSNGETRRFLLARALATRPHTLILDDPYAGLDPVKREKFAAVFEALAARGLGILIIYRHADELPRTISQYFRLTPEGLEPTSEPVVKSTPKNVASPQHRRVASKKPLVFSIKDLTLTYGRRQIYQNFNWGVHEGEYWVLRGPNGSGKTTLFALITGDSPFAYAADITVFGKPRQNGCELRKIREKIGLVSPELQAYSGESGEELLATALARQPRLLLLDEPFVNCGPTAVMRMKKAIRAYLKAHPKSAAVLISHREDDVLKEFKFVLDLGELPRG